MKKTPAVQNDRIYFSLTLWFCWGFLFCLLIFVTVQTVEGYFFCQPKKPQPSKGIRELILHPFCVTMAQDIVSSFVTSLKPRLVLFNTQKFTRQKFNIIDNCKNPITEVFKKQKVREMFSFSAQLSVVLQVSITRHF